MSGFDSYKHNQPFSANEENIVVIGSVDPSGNVVRAASITGGGIKTSESLQQVAGASGAQAFGGVTTGGVLLLTNPGNIVLLHIRNTLDRDVRISVDGGVNYTFFVDSYVGNLLLDLAACGCYTTSNIYVAAVGTNPSAGTIWAGALKV